MSSLQKTAKKIGLVTSIAIIIGSIIGIGIFFKNTSVFLANNGNGIYVLVSWIIAAIVSTATALCFGEACTVKGGGTGIGGWATQLCNKKFGYFTKFNWAIFYYGILIVSICIFTGEALLRIFGVSLENFHISFVILIGGAICAILVVFNLFATNTSRITQVILTSFKFIPIGLIIILGFAFMNKGNNLFVPPQTNDTNFDKWNSASFAGVLASLPAILFAFDSFICVGSLKDEAKSKKTIPLTIIIGMILVSVIYIMITIVQILIGTDSIEKTFNTIFKDNTTARNVFNYIVNITMFLSVLGVANAFSLTCLRTYDAMVKEKIIAYHNVIAKISKGKPLISGAILFGIFGGMWWLIMLIVSSIVGHDGYVDALSNYATLFFFAIYGLVVLFTFINRFTKKSEVDKINNYLFYPMAIISIIGITIAFGYQIFYENIYKLFENINADTSLGVLFGPSNTNKIKVWENAIVFFTMCIVFVVGPFINDFLNQKYMESSKYDDTNYFKELEDNDVVFKEESQQ